MTLKFLTEEIERFLADKSPQVLCINGAWGVGKTYAWRNFLKKAKDNSNVALDKYSYVSLFGVNSIDELKYLIFENTVSGENIGKQPNEVTFAEMARDKNTTRRLGPLVDLAAAFFNRKGVADLIYRSAFLTVREQIICIDDIERAGDKLGAREIIGLTSLLKEERNCKVVILLNEEEYSDREEFGRQLEKVVDVKLGFKLTPDEAAAIGVSPDHPTKDFLVECLSNLGITNIRVIKKIEMLTRRLHAILTEFDQGIIEKAIASAVLASWSKQQPNLAPSMSFLKSYSPIGLALRAGRDRLDDETENNRAILTDYPYSSYGPIEEAIFQSIDLGYLLKKEIQDSAGTVAKEYKKISRDNRYSRAWEEMYHGSLSIDDNEFLDELHRSAISEAQNITPLNINSAIRTLREAGRADQANEIIDEYVKAHQESGARFFDIGSHHFSKSDGLDDALREAFSKKRSSYVDQRDPIEVLRSIGERHGWDSEDVELMARQSIDDFERMFEALQGKDLRSSIEMIRAMGHSHGPHAAAINESTLGALRRIADKSALRRQKIRGMGVDLDE